MITAYGADLVLTPGAGTDIDLAIARMREIVATDPDRYFFPGEFENPDNPRGPARERSRRSGSRAAAASTPSWAPRGRAGGSAASRVR